MTLLYLLAFLLLKADVILSICEVDHTSPDMDAHSDFLFSRDGTPSFYKEYGNSQGQVRTRRSPKPKPKVNLNSLKSSQVNVACRGDMKNLAQLSKQLRSAKKSVNVLMLNRVVTNNRFPAKFFKKYAISPKTLIIRGARSKPLRIDDNAFVGFGEQLTELSIPLGQVKSLSGIKKLKSLQSLILPVDFGKLAKQDFSKLKNLRHLEFRNRDLDKESRIRPDALELLKNLESLTFECKVSDKTESLLKAANKVPSLRELHLSHVLAWKPGALKNLHNLEKLTATYSVIRKLKRGMFDGLKSLTHLELAQSGIENIEPGALNDLNNLQKVDLGFNRLKKLAPDVLSPAPELKKLYLDRNQLTTISASLLSSAPNLEILDLSNNPWICDREMELVVDWIKERQKYRFSWPFELKNVDLMLCSHPLNGLINDGQRARIMVNKSDYFYAFSPEILNPGM